MLFLDQQTRQPIQRLRATRVDSQSGAVLGLGHIQLVVVKGLRSLAHGVPEARSDQRIDNRPGLVAVRFGLGQVADSAAEVVLLHAQEAHARRHPPIVRLLRENLGESSLGLFKAVGVEGGKGGALGRCACDPGVHPRQVGFVLFQMTRDLRVLRMVLEVLAQLRGRSRIGRIPDERLTQGALGVGVPGMLPEDANALGAGLAIVREHDAQLDGVARIAGIARGKDTHGCNRRFLAVGRAIQGLVIGQRNIPVRRTITV